MVTERTTDLPPAPAPHLSPTVVVVDDPETRNANIARIGVGVLLGWPVIGLARGISEPGGAEGHLVLGMLFIVVVGGMLLFVTRPGRIRAGKDWLSSDGGQTWVDLYDLEEVRIHWKPHRYVLTDRRGGRARFHADLIGRYPVVFDLLIRALIQQEESPRRFKGPGWHSLKRHAPPKWLPPKD